MVFGDRTPGLVWGVGSAGAWGERAWKGEVGALGTEETGALGGEPPSLTEGLPCVNVNDEAGGLVSAQELVVHWAKENGAEDAGAAGSQGGHLLFLIPCIASSNPCSPAHSWPPDN